MSQKSRGIAAERALIHAFNSAGWVAFRAAGSGSIRYPCPDIIAGNNMRKLAIEVKRTTAKAQYFSKQEIKDLQFFSERFGAEAWVAIKFFRKEWVFLVPADLEEREKSFVASQRIASLRGLSFRELLGQEQGT
ncbi:Holliday junction resolvase [Candidatus Woesearchaeota archaeon]|nr:MAG: Holliday junction resolvase [Candidatus Woesearchaeota archaeon]